MGRLCSVGAIEPLKKCATLVFWNAHADLRAHSRQLTIDRGARIPRLAGTLTRAHRQDSRHNDRRHEHSAHKHVMLASARSIGNDCVAISICSEPAQCAISNSIERDRLRVG